MSKPEVRLYDDAPLLAALYAKSQLQPAIKQLLFHCWTLDFSLI